MNTFSVTNMGCLKLTYHTTGGSLDVTAENFLRVIGKKGQAEKKRIDYYPFGMTLPGRNYNQNDYKYGFNGMEKDDEVKGSGNSYDFGARLYDARVGRWASTDPLEYKYPTVSPYIFVRDNPLLFIDPDGRKWVNVHTVQKEKIGKLLKEQPNNKKLIRQLKLIEKKEALVDQYINDIKTNDVALYNYIENLRINVNEDKNIDINVNVSSIPYERSGSNGQVASTSYLLLDAEGGEYKGKEIKIPYASESRNIGVDVKIYGQTSYGDIHLANEAGDVMYLMEYNEDAAKETSAEFLDDASYRENGAGKYSFRVDELYKKRKKDGTGKDPNNNPYPIRK